MLGVWWELISVKYHVGEPIERHQRVTVLDAVYRENKNKFKSTVYAVSDDVILVRRSDETRQWSLIQTGTQTLLAAD